jgi:hypothetical protein
VKRFAVVAGLAMAMVLGGFGSAEPAQAAASTKVVRYGPFTIPAGTATDPGMIHNKLLFGSPGPVSTATSSRSSQTWSMRTAPGRVWTAARCCIIWC